MTAADHAQRASVMLENAEVLSDRYMGASEIDKLDMQVAGLGKQISGLRDAAQVHALTALALLAADGLTVTIGGDGDGN